MSVTTNTSPEPGSKREGSRGRDLAFRFAPRYRIVWFALIGLGLFCLISGPKVFNTNSLTLVTGLAGVLAIASAGELIVIMAGGFDLSVPAVITLAAGIIVHQTNASNHRLAGAIVLALVMSLAVGLINGLLVGVARLSAIIVTLAMSGAVTGVILLWLGTTFSASGTVPPSLATFTNRHLGILSIVGLLGFVVVGALALLIGRTSIGRRYLAAGSNRQAAEIIGIRTVRYEVAGYGLAGLLYGVAGIFLAGLLTSPDSTVGSVYQLEPIIAAALGGAALAGGPASFLGTAAACLFLSLLSQYLQIKNLSAGVSDVVNGVVLLAAVALLDASSWGVLPKRLTRGSKGTSQRHLAGQGRVQPETRSNPRDGTAG